MLQPIVISPTSDDSVKEAAERCGISLNVTFMLLSGS